MLSEVAARQLGLATNNLTYYRRKGDLAAAALRARWTPWWAQRRRRLRQATLAGRVQGF